MMGPQRCFRHAVLQIFCCMASIILQPVTNIKCVSEIWLCIECYGFQVQCYALRSCKGTIVIDNNSWLVQALCHLLDLVLGHGLRDWHRGYWPVLREFSHSDTLQAIQTLKTVTTSLGKGNQPNLTPSTHGFMYCFYKGLRIPPFCYNLKPSLYSAMLHC